MNSLIVLALCIGALSLWMSAFLATQLMTAGERIRKVLMVAIGVPVVAQIAFIGVIYLWSILFCRLGF